ncbi:MAG TPA: SOS response-associated peptidase [Vicinamibacteria bacterium]|nr:SOS response-associated peptidase [Vicinamibacteria bacterium]
MCGRFNQTASGEEVAEAFGLDEAPELAPRYNIAPTQPVAVIGIQPKTGRRGLALLTWGLIPRDALGKERGFINARSETAFEKPAFSEAFARRRCLIPATGFYEWQKLDARRRQPWLIRLAAPGPFAFAGLWEPAAAVPGAKPTCTILTTEPNELARRVHDRMPVILDPADYTQWLDPAVVVAAEVRPLLRSFPAAAMTAYPVSTRVNNPAFDDPACLAPA